MLKHSFEVFRILRNGYTNNKIKRKIYGNIVYSKLRTSLNTQEISVSLL